MDMLSCLLLTVFSAVFCICLPKIIVMTAAMVRQVRGCQFNLPQSLKSIQSREIETREISQLG